VASRAGATDTDRDLRERATGFGHTVGGGASDSIDDAHQRARSSGLSTPAVDDAERSDEEERRMSPAVDDAERSDEEERRMGPAGFVAPVPVRWSDIDMYQHVNHATMVTIMEEARVP